MKKLAVNPRPGVELPDPGRYDFVRIKVHPKLDLSGWYLMVSAGDHELLEELHGRVACQRFMLRHEDPHLYDQRTWAPKNEIAAHFHNPIREVAGWLDSAMKALAIDGTFYMNQMGGMIWGAVDILEERSADELRWPTGDDHKEGVRITISQYGDSPHYYLRANDGRIFPRAKYNSPEDAIEEACKHAFRANITAAETPYTYTRVGD